ncbi:MAG: hypothetical protein ACK5LL_06400 [Suipraeoptans sp.]
MQPLQKKAIKKEKENADNCINGYAVGLLGIMTLLLLVCVVKFIISLINPTAGSLPIATYILAIVFFLAALIAVLYSARNRHIYIARMKLATDDFDTYMAKYADDKDLI